MTNNRVSPGLVAEETSHRPWPLPRSPWVLSMRWHDLLFLHWPIRAQLIRPLIPREIELDKFDGSCWIGIVPFHMSGVRLRYLPISFAFPEINVRTYVRTRGCGGVWFFSLDAMNWLAVRAARCLGLPYYRARMNVVSDRNFIHYETERVQKRAASAKFHAVYRPSGRVYCATPGALEHWLTERYCLYAANQSDRIVYGEIHHAPWPLQPAEVDLTINTMTRPLGIELPNTEPVCHFARNQEVVAWPVVPWKV